MDIKDNKLNLSEWGLPEGVLNNYKKRGITQMFPWQAECLSSGSVLEGENLIYTAPTSAGKTLVAEILVSQTVFEKKKKALIILPFVSVVREKMFYFQDMFSENGIRVEGFMGGHTPTASFQQVNVGVCTIEKANSLINKMLEDKSLSQLGIVVVDELHLLGDQYRGYLLELLLTKLKYMSTIDETIQLQVVGMSATLPNLNMLAKWLKAKLYYTDFRPVPLSEHLKCGLNILNKRLEKIRQIVISSGDGDDSENVGHLCIETIANSHSLLIFCPTKVWCENLAVKLALYFRKIGCSKEASIENTPGWILRKQLNLTKLNAVIDHLKISPVGLDKDLAKTVPYGVSFHHAGLTMDERDIIEGSFRNGSLRVLCATSTLSSGVNLPARRVIIRSPMSFGGVMDAMTYRQMIGRAGRMGVDTEGESILICKSTEKHICQQLMSSGLKPIESCLGSGRLSASLKRAILEVVASGIVTTSEQVAQYAASTFLASCSRDNLEDPLTSCLQFLEENELIRLTDNKYIPTPLGLACLASSLPPDEGLALFRELDRARRCFVLDSDLHIIYQITPYSVSEQWGKIDWLRVLNMLEELSPSMRRVAELVGVEDSFLIKVVKSIINISNPEHRSKLSIHRRFYTALALQELVNEVPLAEVAVKFDCNKGMLQSLQQSAATYAGMVGEFAKRLRWGTIELIVSQFQERLQFGVQRELCELLRLPSLNGVRARALFNAGMTSLKEIANSDANTLETALLTTTPFESRGQGAGEAAYEAQQRTRLLNVWITGRAGLSLREAAEILIKEAREILELELGVGAKWGMGHHNISHEASSHFNQSNNISICNPEKKNGEMSKEKSEAEIRIKYNDVFICNPQMKNGQTSKEESEAEMRNKSNDLSICNPKKINGSPELAMKCETTDCNEKNETAANKKSYNISMGHPQKINGIPKIENNYGSEKNKKDRSKLNSIPICNFEKINLMPKIEMSCETINSTEKMKKEISKLNDILICNSEKIDTRPIIERNCETISCTEKNTAEKRKIIEEIDLISTKGFKTAEANRSLMPCYSNETVANIFNKMEDIGGNIIDTNGNSKNQIENDFLNELESSCTPIKDIPNDKIECEEKISDVILHLPSLKNTSPNINEKSASKFFSSFGDCFNGTNISQLITANTETKTFGTPLPVSSFGNCFNITQSINNVENKALETPLPVFKSRYSTDLFENTPKPCSTPIASFKSTSVDSPDLFSQSLTFDTQLQQACDSEDGFPGFPEDIPASPPKSDDLGYLSDSSPVIIAEISAVEKVSNLLETVGESFFAQGCMPGSNLKRKASPDPDMIMGSDDSLTEGTRRIKKCKFSRNIRARNTARKLDSLFRTGLHDSDEEIASTPIEKSTVSLKRGMSSRKVLNLSIRSKSADSLMKVKCIDLTSETLSQPSISKTEALVADDVIPDPDEIQGLNWDTINFVDVCGRQEVFESFVTEMKLQKIVGLAFGCRRKEIDKKTCIGAKFKNNLEENDIKYCDEFTYNDLILDGVAIYWHQNNVFYMSCTRNDIAKEDKLSVLEELSSKTIRIFDMREQLRFASFCTKMSFSGAYEDVKVASWLLSKTGDEDNLRTMTTDFFKAGLGIINQIETIPLGSSVALIPDSPIPAKVRACFEAILTYNIFQKQKEKLLETGLYKLFQEIEMPTIKVLVSMELTGLTFDENKLKNLKREMENHVAALEKRAHMIAGRKFALSSYAAVGKILYTELRLNKKCVNFSKKPNTSKETLEELEIQTKHPLPRIILCWRKLQAILNKTLCPLLQMLPATSVHGSCQTLTVTGRISMKEPNMQNIPRNFDITLENDKRISISLRDIFIAPTGYILLSADYCQIELRILAHLSNDSELISNISSSPDVFNSIASTIYKIPENMVSVEQRQSAKQTCYGIIYGIGCRSLAHQLQINEDVALALMTDFKLKYQGVREFLQKTINSCQTKGYVESLSGRRRYLPAINSENPTVRSEAERQAVNTCIQGSAADLVKKAMIDIMRKSERANVNMNLILHLHDEVIYQVPQKSLKEAALMLKQTMENIWSLKVPLPVKQKSGISWGELQPLTV